MLLLAAALSLSSISSGGWHKVEGENTFDEVAVTRALHDEIVADTNSASFWGNMGPSAVFRAWNSAAFDSTANVLYFFGGGHNDYGGNEVYAYDLTEQKWTRLTDPAPLTIKQAHSQSPDKDVYIPENSPLSFHTYDGVVWNPITKSIWAASRDGFSGAGGKPSHNSEKRGIWEFSPSTKQWVLHPSTNKFGRPMSTFVEASGQVLVIDYREKKFSGFLYDSEGNEQTLGAISGLNGSAIASLFTNPETGDIYSSHKEGIFKITLSGNKASATLLTSYPNIEDFHFSTDYRQAAINFRPTDGKFYIWNGGPRIMTWQPSNNAFELLWNETDTETPLDSGRGVGQVFEKFVYFAAQDLFVGVQNGGSGTGSDGVWAWKPKANPAQIFQLETNDLAVESTTQTSASIVLPIDSGDKNYNAQATLSYRVDGDEDWLTGVELSRVRPEFIRNTKNGTGISSASFAGMIVDLKPSTTYEVKVTITDPDGIIGENANSATKTSSFTTKSIPSSVNSRRTVNVTSSQELHRALASALPGTAIKILPGGYQGNFKVTQSGTEQNPIYIEGVAPNTNLFDGLGAGTVFNIDASNIVVNNLSIENAVTAFAIAKGANNVAIHDNQSRNTSIGINARGGHIGLYIADNFIQGRFAFGNVSSDTWNAEGIVVTGQDIEIVHNTVSGFGDAIGLHWNTPIPNIGINMHRNLVLWSGDDGIEFDFAQRNVAAHHNLVANSANGLSFQPVWGGPVYATHNILLNQGRGPIKIKPEKDHPTGMIIAHNTIIKGNSDIFRGGGEAWKNTSGHIKQLYIYNNLFVSDNSEASYTLKNDSSHTFVEMSHNGWTAEGRFAFNLAKHQYGINSKSFESWQRSELGKHDIMLDVDDIFDDYDPDLDSMRFSDYREPLAIDFSLDDESAAVDAGKIIRGINEQFTGSKPDLGAIERNDAPISYGTRNKFESPNQPIMIADALVTEVNTPLIFFPLANDFIPDDDDLTITAIGANSAGTFVLMANNGITFTPKKDYVGEFVTHYTVIDDDNNESQGVISIRVTPPNSAPIANDDSETATAGEKLVIPHQALLSNDTDVDEQTLTLVSVTSATHGQIELLASSIVYTPPADFLGNDSFTYTIEDELGSSATANVSIEVLGSGTIMGTKYRDHFDLSEHEDGFTIMGLSGSDIIYGSQGDDIIIGGSHEDHLNGNGGDDIFKYTAELDKPDWVHGGAGFDKILGNELNNTIALHELSGIEEIDGGAGENVILGHKHTQKFDFSDVLLRNIALIDGLSHADTIIGSQSNNTIKGSGGNDILDGQGGYDTAVYDDVRENYRMSFSGQKLIIEALITDEGIDTLSNFEAITFADKTIVLDNCKTNRFNCF